MDLVLPKPGSYIVAVSGGVDSVVLLHALGGHPGLKLTVAHFDHGIRPASAEDRRFVQQLAESYDLPFVYDEGHLGPGTGEAAARQARYAFLDQARRAGGAQAIITAHHQDDRLETAVLNLLRGTGRKGLTALKSRPGVLRPLLNTPKNDLLAYAQANELAWHEDPTNADQAYLRNYVRHRLLPRFSAADRAELLRILDKLTVTNRELDAALAKVLLAHEPDRLERPWFTQLPHNVAREVLAAWLRSHELRGFDAKTLERLVTAAKTAPAGKVFPVRAGATMQVQAGHLALAHPER